MLNQILEKLHKDFEKHLKIMAGYPANRNYDYSALTPFLKYHLNNAGDPFVVQSSNRWDDTMAFEQECLAWFARLYELKNHWGYITSGGTESNLYGILLGRERYPDGILYYSKASHYSIPKSAYLLRLQGVVVDTLPNGEMDYSHLAQLLCAEKKPVILNLNLGTTMTGAVDQIDPIVEILENSGLPYHIHCDGALGGLLVPYIEGAPQISFEKYPLDSIAVSGHKFIGAPVPYGVVLTRKSNASLFGKSIEYLGSIDSTITGSRSGYAALALWYALSTRGWQLAEEVANCRRNATRLYKHLDTLGYNPLLNDFSTTVVFDKPSDPIYQKWQLTSEKDRAHMVVLQHFSEEKVTEFAHDLRSGLIEKTPHIDIVPLSTHYLEETGKLANDACFSQHPLIASQEAPYPELEKYLVEFGHLYLDQPMSFVAVDRASKQVVGFSLATDFAEHIANRSHFVQKLPSVMYPTYTLTGILKGHYIERYGRVEHGDVAYLALSSVSAKISNEQWLLPALQRASMLAAKRLKYQRALSIGTDSATLFSLTSEQELEPQDVFGYDEFEYKGDYVTQSLSQKRPQKEAIFVESSLH
ncbi:MAG: histidine decarboxylase [Chloroflexota bacterium]